MSYYRRYKRSYPQDPYWTQARFTSKCTKKDCGVEIKKGSNIWYYPNDKTVYCETCGKQAAVEFQCCVDDEAFYSGGY